MIFMFSKLCRKKRELFLLIRMELALKTWSSDQRLAECLAEHLLAWVTAAKQTLEIIWRVHIMTLSIDGIELESESVVWHSNNKIINNNRCMCLFKCEMLHLFKSNPQSASIKRTKMLLHNEMKKVNNLILQRYSQVKD